MFELKTLGLFVATAIVQLGIMDGVRPTAWDLVGAAVILFGMSIIMFAPRHA